MGRKASRWANLPKGMRARPRGKLIHYYLDTGEKPRREIPLGSDYVLAVQKWAELTSRPAANAGTFGYVVQEYWKEKIPGKAPRTQRDNEQEKAWLLRFFDDPPAPLDGIEPVHIRQYLTWRVKAARAAAEAKNAERVKAKRPPLPIDPKLGQVRANREKALFSHIWNYAREKGFTKLPNPCAGITGFRETARDAVVSEDVLARGIEHAALPLQFALRLALITGQRPADVLGMSEASIRDGVLHVSQGKTKAKLRIVVEGELQTLLDEIRAYKAELREQAGAKVHALALLVNEAGQPLTKHMLRDRFDDMRAAAGIDKKEFQFRDLRATAATEADEAAGVRAAQALLGHSTEAMTATYIRHKVGKKVRPLR
jgi:integrase